ncbi:MAG: hypothetical protein R3217_00870 [Gammaproteobacteria bacterium]|nr:hypothetical protein [Gammaproteobacteria bacterium]
MKPMTLVMAVMLVTTLSSPALAKKKPLRKPPAVAEVVFIELAEGRTEKEIHA